ncbi:MAG: phosphoglycerate mutase [Robiginitomaculum sp.]|nr:MAG: phosphoglycerate mutase [Robiginitomaculum sp.]
MKSETATKNIKKRILDGNHPSDSGQIVQKLLLIRHAKAAAFGREPGDHGRPLSAKGQEHAHQLGDILRRENWVPDLAIVSTAERTRNTWEAMAMGACPVVFEEKLYLASPKTLAEEVRQQGGSGKCLALIGHNPGIAILAHQLLDEGFDHDGPASHHLNGQFKTGWAAAFELREEGPRLAALFDPRV